MNESNYFEIKNFSKCNRIEWNKFCQNSNTAWLWHTYDSIIAKSFWYNYKNLSFVVIDNSNRSEVVCLFPLFFIKRIKLINYSIFESLGGAAFSDKLQPRKKQKLYHFLNSYLTEILIKYKVNKIEFLYSPLTPKLINSSHPVVNPLLPFINKDTSNISWIVNLKKNNNDLLKNCDSYVKQVVRKVSNNMQFKEVTPKNSKKILRLYYDMHLKSAKRNKINTHAKEYFEYIFLKFPRSFKKIFYIIFKKKITTISIFGLFKNDVVYWSNVSSDEGLKSGSNYYCMWKAMEYFNNNNIERFECGEGFINSHDKKKKGLNHFKKSFGGKSFPYFKGEKIKNKISNNIYEILYNLKNRSNPD